MKKFISSMLLKKSGISFAFKSKHLALLANYSTTAPPAARKLLNVYEIPKHIYVEMTNAIMGCYTSKMFSLLIKENLNQISDYQLSFALYRMVEHKIELDENFYNTLVPIIKEFVRNMNREHNKSFGEIICYCGRLNVQDDTLWTLFEQKLLQERLYRYVPLKLLIEMMFGIAEAGRGSPELFEVFEKELIKHRLALDNQYSEIAREAFEKRKLGSPILYKVLEAPRSDFSELKKDTKEISDSGVKKH